ncbi:hypothetical protein SAMN02745121_05155 [Nannocystis exedens]|uniref:Uncharacterized protein n=1 Tax=Nannocystis exedens TaxID=54 RepID=A0A1I2CHZ4_9BACT|nr:hypothetical protein NAEX_01287 [Nannocystis exedens]SFE67967.1 hypothetical protein SAMN02745121_05155 [Nannocystis exedens]
MEHRTRTVAQNEQCTVLQCSCGMLHVSVGSVTVRMRPAAAAGLRDAVAAALQKIEAEDLARGAPRTASRGDDLPS